MPDNSPEIFGAICLADNCNYWWNAFFPKGFSNPTGFIECPKCKLMTAKRTSYWDKKEGGFNDDGSIDLI